MPRITAADGDRRAAGEAQDGEPHGDYGVLRGREDRRWPLAQPREDDGDELEEHGEKAAAHATRNIVAPLPRCN